MRLTLPQLATLVALVSLTFFFGALILAFGLRVNVQPTWQRFDIPSVLWLGTAVLLCSSWTLEAARTSLRRALVAIYRGRIAATISLALLFLCIQTVSALDLISQGVGTVANPHGSAFYAFMAIHGAHLFGGIGWLLWIRARSRRLFAGTESDLRSHRRTLSAAALYWHFMGVLWLVLYSFLRFWTAA